MVTIVFTGLDTFGDHPDDASEYIRPLLEFAASHIPTQQHKETLLYILATAGMRLLPEEYVSLFTCLYKCYYLSDCYILFLHLFTSALFCIL